MKREDSHADSNANEDLQGEYYNSLDDMLEECFPTFDQVTKLLDSDPTDTYGAYEVDAEEIGADDFFGFSSFMSNMYENFCDTVATPSRAINAAIVSNVSVALNLCHDATELPSNSACLSSKTDETKLDVATQPLPVMIPTPFPSVSASGSAKPPTAPSHAISTSQDPFSCTPNIKQNIPKKTAQVTTKHIVPCFPESCANSPATSISNIPSVAAPSGQAQSSCPRSLSFTPVSTSSYTLAPSADSSMVFSKRRVFALDDPSPLVTNKLAQKQQQGDVNHSDVKQDDLVEGPSPFIADSKSHATRKRTADSEVRNASKIARSLNY